LQQTTSYNLTSSSARLLYLPRTREWHFYNRCELEGSILSAGEVELMPRLLDLLATRDADENMKNAHRALWKYEQVKSEDEISPIQGSSARSKPKSCACMYNSWWHGGVVGLTLANGVSTPSTIAQAPTLFHVRRLRTQVSASNRQSRSSICIIPHYGVRIMLVTGPSQTQQCCF